MDVTCVAYQQTTTGKRSYGKEYCFVPGQFMLLIEFLFNHLSARYSGQLWHCLSLQAHPPSVGTTQTESLIHV